MKITGTFLDEITVDIVSNNWSRDQWSNDFKAMKNIGIDTVILIRSGWKRIATFNSKVLQKHMNILPVYRDLVSMFLDLAEEHQMEFYFGTYDSGLYWRNEQHEKEIEISKQLVDEVWDIYGSRKAFKGWYLTLELGCRNDTVVQCLYELGMHCKNISDNKLPCLISPYIMGCKTNNPLTLEQHQSQWDNIFGKLEGAVDIVAFQDGMVDFYDLPAYLEVNNELIRKHGMRPWSNVESFDRDTPVQFPPIDWQKLWWKLSGAENSKVEKIITFEFSHFMSPNSSWQSAHNLYNLYCEHFKINPRYYA